MTEGKINGTLSTMGPLVVIIAIELIVGSSILGFSAHPKVLNNAKHQISNVLGVQQIAQVDDTSTPPTTDSSANNSSTTPTDQSSSISNTTLSTESPAPSKSTDTTTPSNSNNTQPATAEVSPTSTPSDQSNSGSPSIDQSSLDNSPSPSETPLEEPVPSSTPIQPESNEIQTQAVLNPAELINSPDNINSQSVAETKKEDDQIEKTQDPQEQTKLLVAFATDKVKDMSNFTKSDDFASTNFAVARFNDQINKAISNLDKLPSKERVATKKQLTNFCNQADQVLRTVELSVPEESEQDIQMARGQCQELQL